MFGLKKLAKRIAALEDRLPIADHFFEIVGGATIAWAYVEVFLDLANAVIFYRAGGDQIQSDFPVSLRAKLAFFRRALNRIPELADFQERGLAIADRIGSLKERRHDLIHGIAYKTLPNGVRVIHRHAYDRNVLSFAERNYSEKDLAAVLKDIRSLLSDLEPLTKALDARFRLGD